jgi:hypothetical protein
MLVQISKSISEYRFSISLAVSTVHISISYLGLFLQAHYRTQVTNVSRQGAYAFRCIDSSSITDTKSPFITIVSYHWVNQCLVLFQTYVPRLYFLLEEISVHGGIILIKWILKKQVGKYGCGSESRGVRL